MRRLHIFAKGNVDVHDSLHSCRVGGTMLWNGINEALRDTHPGLTVRLRHETLTRFDALLAADGVVPAVLAERELPLGSYPLGGQFSGDFYARPSDAVVLSILPDVAASMARNRAEGFLFYPADAETWPAAERNWLTSEFDRLGLAAVQDSMANLAAVVARLRETQDVPVLVYNMSAVIPGDFVHCYLGLDESYATRVRRYNLALVELSQAIGISIVDVDAVLARHGADRLKIDAMHLTPDGYRLVAREVVRILDDLGVLENLGAVEDWEGQS